MASSFRSVSFSLYFFPQPHLARLTQILSDLCLDLALLLCLALYLCFPFSVPGNSGPHNGFPYHIGYRHSVFGIDHRREIEIKQTPFQPIGRIELQAQGVLPWKNPQGTPICTGTLVGPDLVLTNSHCLLDRSSGLFTEKSIWFRPALGKKAKEIGARATKAWLGTLYPSKQRSEDWALIKLDQPLGETFGWLETAPLVEDQPFIPSLVSFIAYATDYKDGSVPLIHSNCHLTAFDSRGSYFRHNCHMNAGSSGGPLLGFKRGRPHILAINAAHITPSAVSYLPKFTAKFANIAIGSIRFREAIHTLKGEKAKEKDSDSLLSQLTVIDIARENEDANLNSDLSPSPLPRAH